MIFNKSKLPTNEYRIALAGRNKILNWNPNLEPIGAPERQLYNQVFDYLVYQSVEGGFSSGISNIEIQKKEGILNLIFNEHTFHDNSKIKTHDALQCIINSAEKIKFIDIDLYNVLTKKIKASENALSIEITSEAETNKILTILSSPSFAIFKSGHSNCIPNTNIVGCGPYRVIRIDDQEIHLKPFKNHHEYQKTIPNLIFLSAESENSKYGAIDEHFSFGKLKNDSKNMLEVKTPNLGLGVLLFNLNAGPLSKIEARKQFSDAISNAILSGSYDTSWLPPSGLIPPSELQEQNQNVTFLNPKILTLQPSNQITLRIGVTNLRQELRLKRILESKHFINYNIIFKRFVDLVELKKFARISPNDLDIAFVAIRKEYGLKKEFIEFSNNISPLAIFETQNLSNLNSEQLIQKMALEAQCFPIGYYQETRWVKPEYYLKIGKEINSGPPRYTSISAEDWYLKFENLKFNQEFKIKTEQDLRTKVALSDLLTRTAHDIKSPLSALKFLGSSVTMDNSNKEIWELSIERIESILSNILEHNFLTPKTDVDIETINIENIVNRAKKEVSLYSIAKCSIRTDFYNDCEKNKEIILPKCDIQSLITNLIKNSCESTRNNEINITVSILSLAPLKISIIDNGPGFSAEVFDKLGKQKITTKEYGSGIGLLQTKHVLEKVGGSISLRNTQCGAEVSLIIPTIDTKPLNLLVKK